MGGCAMEDWKGEEKVRGKERREQGVDEKKKE